MFISVGGAEGARDYSYHIIDSNLRFHEHITVVVGKAGGLMNELLRSTVCRNRLFMVTLFVSHI